MILIETEMPSQTSLNNWMKAGYKVSISFSSTENVYIISLEKV